MEEKCGMINKIFFKYKTADVSSLVWRCVIIESQFRVDIWFDMIDYERFVKAVLRTTRNNDRVVESRKIGGQFYRRMRRWR